MLDLQTIGNAQVTRDPFTFFVAASALSPANLAAVKADFPEIRGTGVYPPEELTYGPAFRQLLDEIRSPQIERLLAEKLGLELEGRPLMITVRGHCHRRDGKIHTDSVDKIATVLLYLNDDWKQGAATSSGCLRLLRNGHDLEDKIAEVPPNGGTLVAFRRSDNSWHGHHPFEGPRRYIMFNWLASDGAYARNVGRHSLSARLKRWLPGAAVRM